MATRTNHVGFNICDRCHFVIIVIQDGFVDLVAICYGGIGQEPLNLLFESVVGIGNVTG